MRAFVLLVPLWAMGCFAGSVQPWFPDADRVEEPRALGTWKQNDGEGSTVLTVSALSNKLYRVSMTETDKPDATRFVVAIGMVGKQAWLDVQLDGDDEHLKHVDTYVLRPHFALRAALKDDALELQLLDKDWFIRQVEKKKVKLPFIPPTTKDGLYLFTAATPQLRDALKSTDKDPKAFAKAVAFVRVKP